MIIDTHSHYNLEPFFPEWKSYWEAAFSAGVNASIVIGTTEETSRTAVEIAESDPNLFASIGVHPTEKVSLPSEEFWKLASSPKVVAIGECGLDYARLSEDPKQQALEKEFQISLLLEQTKIAKQYDLPMVIHCRDAHADLLKTLQYGKVVLHCMSGDITYLKEALHRGWYISFAANVSHKNAAVLRELATATPLNRILIETDAPFLPPQSKRGKTNLPEYIIETAQTLADLLGLSYESFCTQTTVNAETIFPKLKK